MSVERPPQRREIATWHPGPGRGGAAARCSGMTERRLVCGPSEVPACDRRRARIQGTRPTARPGNRRGPSRVSNCKEASKIIAILAFCGIDLTYSECRSRSSSFDVGMCIQSDQGGRPVKITVETVVKADSSAVWRAWNNPEDIKQWNAASDDGTRPRALGARPRCRFCRSSKPTPAAHAGSGTRPAKCALAARRRNSLPEIPRPSQRPHAASSVRHSKPYSQRLMGM